MTNLDKQADEILALQAIFETNFHQLDEHRYELLIHFDLTAPVTIAYAGQISIVECLPPLTLIIHYDGEYPSDHPASFLLSCFYLSKLDLRELCQKLDQYPFVAGEVCVYEWINIIKHAIPNQLILDPKLNKNEDGDPRALNGYSIENAERIFQQLIDYNTQQFHQQMQTCLICKNTLPGVDCIRLHQCRHLYCQTCLTNSIRLILDNDEFGDRICCPQQQCQQVLMPFEIKQIVRDEQLYDRYERLILQRSLKSMDDVIWCPKCQCPLVIDESDNHLVMCDRCQYIFCKNCLQIFHSQRICPKDSLRQQSQSAQATISQQQTSNGAAIQRGGEQTATTLSQGEGKNQATQIHQRIIMGYGHMPVDKIFCRNFR